MPTGISVELPPIGTLEAWRHKARLAWQQGIEPERLRFRLAGSQGDLLSIDDAGGSGEQAARTMAGRSGPTVPRRFVELAEAVSCHRDASAFDLLTRLLWRVAEDPGILRDPADPQLARLEAMEKAVRRDSHKMKAFVRFRELENAMPGERRRFAAWFEPEHRIVERVAPFFARRFGDMDWMIATPTVTAHCIAGMLRCVPSEERPSLPDDAQDELWRTYFAAIFNPARLKVKAMKAEMPVKYWKNLPEAALIPRLISEASARTQAMTGAAPSLPNRLARHGAQRLAQLLPPPETRKASDCHDTTAGERGAGRMDADQAGSGMRQAKR